MAKPLSPFEAELKRLLLLGTDVATGGNVYVPLDALTATSAHVVGASGYGKSYFLRSLILQLIRFRAGFCVIDPHRELCDFTLGALRCSALRRAKIVLLDPGAKEFSVGFNPLCCGVNDPGEASSLVLEAIAKTWHTDFDATPRLERLLRGTVRLLVDNELTLAEAPDVLNVDNGALRRTLCDRLSDPWIRQDWQEFEKWPRSDRIALVESTRNRLQRVLQADRVRLMLGQRQAVLNVQKVMDDGGVIMANVGNTPAPETKRLLGALVLNAIYHAAKQRNPRRRRPFFVIVDEVGQFASSDLANSLDELRKFGAHFVLVGQRLQQIQREDGDVLSAVMTNAKIKVVFGGLERAEAERLARELFTGRIRPDRVKHISVATKFRPVTQWVDIETQSWTESSGDTESEAWGRSTSSSRNGSESALYDVDDEWNLSTYEDEDILSRTLASSTSDVESASHSSSLGRTRSRTIGGSRGTVPMTEHEEFEEETGRQFWSVEEQWEELTSAVHRLGKREALVRIYNGPVHHVCTADVVDRIDERANMRFADTICAASPYARRVADVLEEIDGRRRRLQGFERPQPIRSFKE